MLIRISFHKIVERAGGLNKTQIYIHKMFYGNIRYIRPAVKSAIFPYPRFNPSREIMSYHVCTAAWLYVRKSKLGVI
jgi:hypothetical protein